MRKGEDCGGDGLAGEGVGPQEWTVGKSLLVSMIRHE